MPPQRPIILLAHGFRPFFLLAGLYGALPVAVWLAAFGGALALPGAFSPMLWHGHEMLFGFATAALCGFLLTAVPNWTQTEAVKGGRLALLVVLWLAGRMAFFLADILPPAAVAAADILLIPVLAVMVGAPIFARRQKRNYFFPALLIALFAANSLFHLGNMGLISGAPESGLYLALYAFAMILSLISGRVVPNFTVSAIRLRGEEAEFRISMPLELSAFVAIAATAVADLSMDGGFFSGVLALVAAALLGLRMKNWHTGKSLGEPLLWVLHLGGAWLVLGFVSLGLADLTGVISKNTAFHALTIGAMGTMALGIMTRASLGHSGRPFILAKPIPAAYLLVSLAALARVAGPAAAPSAYQTFVMVAGLFWAAAFAIFTIVYWPILTQPRADGKPG